MASIAMAQESQVDEAAVRAELDEILEHPDFRRLRLEINPPEVSTTWWERFVDWLGSFFQARTAPNLTWLGEAFRIFAYAVIAVLACGIVWLVVKAVNAWRDRQKEKLSGVPTFEEGGAELPPGDLPADEYLRRARDLAAQGLFGEAIAQLLLGAMSATERSGLIRFRRGLTYRDYMRALRPRPEPCQAFHTLVAIYLPIGFGRRPAASSQFATALSAYEAAFARALSPVPTEPVPAVAEVGDGAEAVPVAASGNP